jgi:N-glycosylase/DNA lyase
LQRFTEGQFTSLQNRIPVSHFSLERTLKCGQTFRVFEKKGMFLYPYGKSLLALRQESDFLYYEVYGKPLGVEQVRSILGLNDDIGEINTELSNKVKGFNNVIDNTLGIRIMRQLPFETTISFMFSVQSAIPLIRRRLNMLSELAGEKLNTPFGSFFLFPESKDIRKLSDSEIKDLKLGFREKWFREFIENYDEVQISKIAQMDFEKKEHALMQIKGVGIKVAHCIMLFSMNELSAFPVDVWIKRGMEELFGVTGTTKKITGVGRKMFGQYAGYAQEYIYYYIRKKHGAEGGT